MILVRSKINVLKAFLPLFLLLSTVSIQAMETSSMDTPLLDGNDIEMNLVENSSSTNSSPESTSSETPLVCDEESAIVARKLFEDEGFLSRTAKKMMLCAGCTRESALKVLRSRAFKEVSLLTFETGLVALGTFYANASGNDSIHVWSSILAKMGADFVSHRKFYVKGIPASIVAGLNTILFTSSQPGTWVRGFATNMYWALGTFLGSAAHHDFGVASERIESAERKRALTREME